MALLLQFHNGMFRLTSYLVLILAVCYVPIFCVCSVQSQSLQETQASKGEVSNGIGIGIGSEQQKCNIVTTT